MRISEHIWKRSVWKQIRHRDKSILPAASGAFHAVIRSDSGGDYISASGLVENGTGLIPLLRELLVAGAKPFGITGVLLWPEEQPESELRSRVIALERECAEHDLEILQLEVAHSGAVKDILLTVTALGKVPETPAGFYRNHGEPGQDIVMTGWTGLAGTKELIRDNREKLLERFPEHFIRKTEELPLNLLPERELAIAGQFNVTAVQAAGTGGVLDVLWQLGESAGIGMEISFCKLPVRQETIEITEVFEINPYQLESGGVLLFLTNQGEALAERFRQEGIPAAVIGTVRQDKDRVLLMKEERRFLEPFREE